MLKRKKFQKIKEIIGLSLSLSKAEIKTRNEGSYLGVFWYLLEPLALFFIILILRSVVGGNKVENYALYLLIGLIMFNFFTGVTRRSIKSIIGKSSFVKSMKIPKEPLVFSGIIQAVFSHMFEIVLLIAALIYFNLPVLYLLFYPLIFVFYLIFVIGISLILSTIGTYIIDLENVWRVFTRLLFFATPLFYIVEKGTIIYKISLFNPLYYFITIARDIIIYNTIPELWKIFIMITFSLLFFIIGIIIFERNKNKFAEFV
ncbi:ABC transporter permease [Candidatus Pacearchaeota archaeon]|nr:ABC transporter permease [Candidatus Pacearchaeota archaeon]